MSYTKSMFLDYNHVLHFLFPLSKDELRIKNCTVAEFVSFQQISKGNGVISLLPYSDSRVRAAIHLAKFHNQSHAKKLLSAVLTSYLSTFNASARTLIPVPLSPQRKRKRGYNQVEEVLKGTNIPSSITYTPSALHRTKNTVPQTTLSREKRLDNMAEVFEVPYKGIPLIQGKRILLIDDVTTTGATLHAAKAELLLHSPASVTCIALAH